MKPETRRAIDGSMAIWDEKEQRWRYYQDPLPVDITLPEPPPFNPLEVVED